ncbi:MAG: general secretion pathway protein GspK [Kiloniellaceae bacterium]
MRSAVKKCRARLGREVGRRGLALISVLWVLTLLSLIAASFTRTTRTEINLARNQAENARAEALADAGVYTAVLGLMINDPENGWRADGTVYAWRFGDGEIRAAVWDEGGKIDINVATDQLLRNLFVAVGVDERKAAALVDAIVDFRDPNELRRLNGAEDRDYRDAGLPYGAKDAPFETLDELRQVLGMTATLFEQVAPALTVHARQRVPHQPTAPPLVQAALAGETLPSPEEGQEGPEADGAGSEGAAQSFIPDLSDVPRSLGPVTPVPRSRVPVYTVHAEARTDSGAVFVRDAVVRVRSGGPEPFEFQSWRQGRRELFGEQRAAE